jgi:Gram-negative porin
MVTVSGSRGVAVVVGLVASLAGTGVQAASEVDLGGFHDQTLEVSPEGLLGPGSSPATDLLGARVEVRTAPAPASALTAFTPRLGGLGLAVAGRRHSEASLLADDRNPQSHRLQIGVRDLGAIAGWEVGLAATADMGPAGTGTDGGSSALAVGGELAVSGLRFDAGVGRDDTLTGLDGHRVTAGIGYDFGALDTRMSYSLVETEERAEATGLLTLGSQLALKPNLVLKGDLAIAEEEDGAATTAGRVSLRLNF